MTPPPPTDGEKSVPVDAEILALPTERGPAPSPADATERETRLLLVAVRVGFAILFVVVVFLAILNTSGQGAQGGFISYNAPQVLILSLITGIVVLGIDLVTKRRRISTLGSLFVGLLIAILATILMNAAVDLLFQLYDIENPSLLASAKVIIGIALTYLCISTVLQTKDDFRLVIPYVEFAKQIRGVRPMLLDTSVLVDARITDVATTGVLQAPLIVPRFVIGELQALADSSDKLKRAKGRRGLGVVTKLQRIPGLDVSIDETQVPGKAVDQMLIELAQAMPATIATTDMGLARVAAIQNVGVLNLNDLAAALRAPVAAGDRVTVRVTKEGEQPGQGVGYLDDGTMIVVEGGASRVGQDVAVVIGTALHTAGGRLVFAKPIDAGAGDLSHAAAHRVGATPDLHEPGASVPASSEDGGEKRAAVDGGGAPAAVPPPTDSSDRRPGPGPFGPGSRPRATPRNPRR